MLAGALWTGAAALPAATGGDEEIDFDREIRPVLSDRCFHCHGFDDAERKADLRLDTFEGATASRDGAPAVVPGDPAASELVRRIRAADPDDVMPPPGSKLSLSAAEIELLERWVADGAVYQPHWAFRQVRRPAVPRSGHPVDRFVREKLAEAGLEPNPPAAPHEQVRRLALDLTGLPPDPADVASFGREPSDEAWAALVDRYLTSPHFGERLAWTWLDAARYADSNGYQGDPDRTMWPWRDWLVAQLNANKPFDQLTVEMLAGDLLPDATPDQVLATGFNRNHPLNGEGGRIADETRVENVFDRTETTATVWMGLTFTCARCHDHKYDPVSQRDYFALYAFFNQTSENGRPGPRPGQQAPVAPFTPAGVAEKIEAAQRSEAAARDALVAIESEVRNSRGIAAGQRADLDVPPSDRTDQWERIEGSVGGEFPSYAGAAAAFREALGARRDAEGERVDVMVMDSLPAEERRETFILSAGNYAAPTGVRVAAGTPAALPAPGPMAGEKPEPDRLDLARWLVSPENPLTARVAVNRLWQMLFGTGIVKTAEDFGAQGERPTHPELLDWLAAEYAGGGWDTKALLKTILTSETYRQSASVTPEQLEVDPGNRLLARSPRYRLPSWVLRDQALAVCGLLRPELGGPPVKPYQPDGVWDDASFGKIRYQRDHGDALYRRTIYTFWRRIAGPTMLFDSAKRVVCEVIPALTNTPLHALTALNDTTQVEAARALAGSSLARCGAPGEAIGHAFRAATARAPSTDELALLTGRLRTLTEHYKAHPEAAAALLATGDSPNPGGLDPAGLAAATAVCNIILNLDEVLTRP